eukprot:1342041-Alexandrium_andersonii.AAC.2
MRSPGSWPMRQVARALSPNPPSGSLWAAQGLVPAPLPALWAQPGCQTGAGTGCSCGCIALALSSACPSAWPVIMGSVLLFGAFGSGPGPRMYWPGPIFRSIWMQPTRRGSGVYWRSLLCKGHALQCIRCGPCVESSACGPLACSPPTAISALRLGPPLWSCVSCGNLGRGLNGVLSAVR